jgi:RNA polymerase sigma-70 factor, ECF subfamily
MATATQDALLAAAQAGDVTALNRLLTEHRHGVYRFGLKVCRTTEDTEDAVQQALWAATRAIKAFRGGAASIASWLFTMVRRECVRLFESRNRRQLACDRALDEIVDDGADPENLAILRQRTEALAGALSELDPLHREVVLLRDIQQLSAPAAAAQLGISVEALKSRLHRARTQLRHHVLARLGAPPAASATARAVATCPGYR